MGHSDHKTKGKLSTPLSEYLPFVERIPVSRFFHSHCPRLGLRRSGSREQGRHGCVTEGTLPDSLPLLSVL